MTIHALIEAERAAAVWAEAGETKHSERQFDYVSDYRRVKTHYVLNRAGVDVGFDRIRRRADIDIDSVAFNVLNKREIRAVYQVKYITETEMKASNAAKIETDISDVDVQRVGSLELKFIYFGMVMACVSIAIVLYGGDFLKIPFFIAVIIILNILSSRFNGLRRVGIQK